MSFFNLTQVSLCNHGPTCKITRNLHNKQGNVFNECMQVIISRCGHFGRTTSNLLPIALMYVACVFAGLHFWNAIFQILLFCLFVSFIYYL